MKQHFYFNTQTWSITTDIKQMPNTIKVPIFIPIILGPALGALFVIFLPILGFYLIGKVLIEKVFRLNVHSVPCNEPSTSQKH